MFSHKISDGSSASSIRHTLPPITASWLTCFLVNLATCSSHRPSQNHKRSRKIKRLKERKKKAGLPHDVSLTCSFRTNKTSISSFRLLSARFKIFWVQIFDGRRILVHRPLYSSDHSSQPKTNKKSHALSDHVSDEFKHARLTGRGGTAALAARNLSVSLQYARPLEPPISPGARGSHLPGEKPVAFV